MCTTEYDCRLPEEAQTYARDVLHETEGNRKFAIEELKKWALNNPELNVRTEDNHLLPFLRVSKFDLVKTKQRLTNFYSMRRDIPEWFSNRNPRLSQIQELMKIGSFLILKKLADNKLVMIVRPTIHDPKLHHIDDVIKAGLMIIDVAMMEEELAQIYGVILIIDVSNPSFSLLKQMTPYRIKNLVNAWQNFHCRPQNIEFVNAPSYVNRVLDIFKKFMSAKLKKRVHVCHGGFSSVIELVGKNVLPKEYGGLDCTLEELGLYWCHKLIDYSDWFLDDERYKAEVEASTSWFSHSKSKP